MSIKIEIPEHLREKTTGQSTVEVVGDTLRECLLTLVQRYPGLRGEIVDDRGILLLKWVVSVNGKIVNTSDELSHPVTDGDVIMLLPMMAGG
jgi:molybdopterin converting factor small subunit